MSTDAKPTVRCSSLPRLDNCPGSRAAESNIKGTTSEAAESGTTIHHALAVFAKMPEALANADNAEYAIESVIKSEKLEDRNEFVFRWFANVVYATIAERGGALEIITEKKLSLDLGPATLEGSPDLMILTPEGLDVFEYKTGMADQDTADEHLQGQGYTVLATDALAKESARLHVLAAGNEKGENHTFTDYDHISLDITSGYIKEVIEEALGGNPSRTVSLEACRYCKAAGTQFCPESVQAVEKFEGNVIKMNDPIAVFNALQPAQRTETLERAQLVYKIAEKIVKAAKSGLIADADFLPGYEIGKGSTVRGLPDACAVFKVLNSRLGIGPADFQAICKVSLKDCIKLVHEIQTRKAKAAGEKPPTKKSIEESVPLILKDVIENKAKGGSIQKVKADNAE